MVAIALELQRARRADAREFLFHTYEKFNELAQERKLIAYLEVSNIEELIIQWKNSETRIAYRKLYNFWDLLTKSVRDNAVGKRIAFEHFGAPFTRWFNKYALAQQQWTTLGNGIPYFESFEWFNKELRKMYPGEEEAVEIRIKYIEKVQNQ